MDSDVEYDYEDCGDEEDEYVYDDEDGDVAPATSSTKGLNKTEMKRENSNFHIPYDDYVIKSSADIAPLMHKLAREVGIEGV